MTDLRTAAQQALRALEQCGLDDTHRSYEFEHAARAALRAALAEPEQDTELAAALGWPGGVSTPILDRHVLLDIAAKQRSAALAEPKQQACPGCGGPADNGLDRSVPPEPYFCSKCMAEPKQKPWRCACGANLYIDENGAPRSKA